MAPRPVAKIIFCTFSSRALSPKTRAATASLQNNRPSIATNFSGQNRDSNSSGARRLIQRSAFAEQLHNRHNHVDHRPGRGENNHGKRRHLPCSFPRRFDSILPSQVKKIPEPRSIFSVRRPKTTAPLTETGMKKIVCLRKASLAARGRTPRFHRL